jgi:hypothetical protein
VTTRNIENRQFAIFFGESAILAVPPDFHTVTRKDGTLFRRLKSFVLLKRSISAVPRVRFLSVSVRDAIEAIKNSAVMR